jgi:hypothetical protein
LFDESNNPLLRTPEALRHEFLSRHPAREFSAAGLVSAQVILDTSEPMLEVEPFEEYASARGLKLGEEVRVVV